MLSTARLGKTSGAESFNITFLNFKWLPHLLHRFFQAPQSMQPIRIDTFDVLDTGPNSVMLR